MTILLGPDASPEDARRRLGTGRAGPLNRIASKIVRTVRSLARFAYDLLKDLF
jgi:hypothetical protein